MQTPLSIDWRFEGDIVRIKGNDAAIAALYYEDLKERFPGQETESSNLEFWLGFYELKDDK